MCNLSLHDFNHPWLRYDFILTIHVIVGFCNHPYIYMDVADIGVMSGAAIFIKEDLKLSDVQLEILMGILNIYSLVGSGAAGRTSDWIGRRYTIVLAGAFFFCGALLMGFANKLPFHYGWPICSWYWRRLCYDDRTGLHG